MITRYSDHAANERTFLAWVRTAIAMMAFGFVIERFDLFLRYAAPLTAQQKIAPHGGAYANAAGLAFIVLGYRYYCDRRLALCSNREGH
jgi:putative membrane protein